MMMSTSSSSSSSSTRNPNDSGTIRNTNHNNHSSSSSGDGGGGSTTTTTTTDDDTTTTTTTTTTTAVDVVVPQLSLPSQPAAPYMTQQQQQQRSNTTHSNSGGNEQQQHELQQQLLLLYHPFQSIVCQEARIVLTALRNGPPHIARGDLAHELVDVRRRCMSSGSSSSGSGSTGSGSSSAMSTGSTMMSNDTTNGNTNRTSTSLLVSSSSSTRLVVLPPPPLPPPPPYHHQPPHDNNNTTTTTTTNVADTTTDPNNNNNNNSSDPGRPPSNVNSSSHGGTEMTRTTAVTSVVEEMETITATTTTQQQQQQQQVSSSSPTAPATTTTTSTLGNTTTDGTTTTNHQYSNTTNNTSVSNTTNTTTMTTTTAGSMIRPFLRVITDPRASGVPTLVALRSIQRMVRWWSMVPSQQNTTASTRTNKSSSNNNNNNHHHHHRDRQDSSSTSSTTTTTSISLLQYYQVSAYELCHHILGCKFEQTNPIYDEAVEMAIADVLQYILQYYYYDDNDDNNDSNSNTDNEHDHQQLQFQQRQLQYIPPHMILDAFNTIFVTRHTFLHTSTALTDHLEDVLMQICIVVFSNASISSSSGGTDSTSSTTPITASSLLMEFLVNQLLHTPLMGNHSGSHHSDGGSSGNGGGGVGGSSMNNHTSGGGGGGGGGGNSGDTTREARQSHDDTRIVCLKFIRRALQEIHSNTTGSGSGSNGRTIGTTDIVKSSSTTDTIHPEVSSIHDVAQQQQQQQQQQSQLNAPGRSLISIIQDELCLSLLMTGQAIWAGTANISVTGSTVQSPGFISLDVLSEICNVISVLWQTHQQQQHQSLIAQFETIWTGFFTRALVLLRKRPQPIYSATLFHANALFDAEIEIILESLVDLLCLQNDHYPTVSSSSLTAGNGGTIKTLFSLYDCHLRRADVSTGLLVELSRCCGGTVIDTEGQFASSIPTSTTPLRNNSRSDFNAVINSTNINSNTKNGNAGSTELNNADDLNDSTIEKISYPVRSVPAHLKELCAQALTGGMKCLFREDHASPETVRERLQRTRSIMIRQMNSPNGNLDDIDINNNSDDYDGNYPIGTTKSHVLRDLKSKKRLMAKAARIFNKKASRGIEFLVDAGLVPAPITPTSVASFLRNGIVVGLDKRAVGAYLGEAGKAAMAGKSPPTWERDWFHKDVLHIYCTLFRFEDQTLLDGLRMFLATFRLPGEAQQIDRILQAFSDTCSHVCEECKIGIFSSDPKRASDAAYLLSFSIIMLNTDRHNKNIREDRKMSCDDFYKNNFDYGRDITEKGKEFPREYLASIYESINEEEIRTEGEGADGDMTVERWKDVLRGCTDDELDVVMPTSSDADDVTELVLEHVWRPIISAIGALWNVHASRSQYLDTPIKPAEGSLLGVQGARLGMDMATEMLNGVCQLGRVDIFHRLFICVCDYTGLLGDYTEGTTDRAWAFANSLESQAAAIVAIRTATESGENLDEECWARVWAIAFELRDLKFITHHKKGTMRGILQESDPDLLNEVARFDWTMCLEKGDMDYCSRPSPEKSIDKGGSLFGAFGRALFGSPVPVKDTAMDEASSMEQSIHGKEALVVWDDGALRDDDDDGNHDDANLAGATAIGFAGDYPTLGMQFEDLLVRENMEMNRQMDMPVTGLERMDEARHLRSSPHSRARRRLGQSCDLSSIVTECRFMDELAITTVLKSLINLVSSATTPPLFRLEPAPPSAMSLDRCSSDASLSSGSEGVSPLKVPISPASEAFAEVLICELALKNKDRLKTLWTDVLQDHYLSNLTRLLINPEEGHTTATKTSVDPGLEKRVTGLLRLTICAVKRKDVANDILSAWKYVLPVNDGQHAASPLRFLFRQIGEGLWRIAVDVDSVNSNLNVDGWEGLVSLLGWCAKRGSMMKPVSSVCDGSGSGGSLSVDDPALQCYRTLHLLLSTKELDGKVPCSVLWSLRCLVAAGGRRNYPQLSIASLDLLDILHEKKLQTLTTTTTYMEPTVADVHDGRKGHSFWSTCWRNIMDGIAEAAELSTDSNIRQHALSILTDLFLKKQPQQPPPPTQPSNATSSSSLSSSSIPIDQFCMVLSEVCIPLAGRRIVQLQQQPYSNPHQDGTSNSTTTTTTDQCMMEFELCIGLMFKPLRQQLPNLIRITAPPATTSVGTTKTTIVNGQQQFTLVWMAVLTVLEQLFHPNHTAMTASSIHIDNNDDDPSSNNNTVPYNNNYQRNHTSNDNNNHHHNHTVLSDELIATMNSLAKEHLQSAILVLLSMGLLLSTTSTTMDDTTIPATSTTNTNDTTTATTNMTIAQITTQQTWISVRRMGFTDTDIQQWIGSSQQQQQQQQQQQH